MRKAVLSLCFLSLSFPFLNAANCFDDDDRMVTGLMHDGSGSSFAFATLTVTEQGSNTSCSLTTDGDGRFTLWINPEERYVLTFEANGQVVEFRLEPETAMNPGQDHILHDGGVSITFGDPPDDGELNGENPGVADFNDTWRLKTTGPDQNDPEDETDPTDPNNGGVSITFGDLPDDGELNGEPEDATHRPKMGWLFPEPAPVEISSIGNRLHGGIHLDRTLAYGSRIRKFRFRFAFTSDQAQHLFLENIELNEAMLHNGKAVVSVFPTAGKYFDIEIEAVNGSEIDLDNYLMKLDLVHSDPNATFTIEDKMILGLVRVTYSSGSVKYFSSLSGGRPTRN